MAQKVAEKDIIEKNELGQNVVIAHAGQPIPDWYEAKSSSSGKAQAAPPENKARTAPAKKSR